MDPSFKPTVWRELYAAPWVTLKLNWGTLEMQKSFIISYSFIISQNEAYKY